MIALIKMHFSENHKQWGITMYIAVIQNYCIISIFTACVIWVCHTKPWNSLEERWIPTREAFWVEDGTCGSVRASFFSWF